MVAIRDAARLSREPVHTPNTIVPDHALEPLGGGLIQIRWHGRGGQGVVTASRVLATATLSQGLYPQSLPDFGAERSGAPLAVYTRVSARPFWDHSHVVSPDIVVVMDETLIGRVPVLDGLVPWGTLIVNTGLRPGELRARLAWQPANVWTVDASAISTELLGRNLPNVAVLGAFIRAVPVVPPACLAQALGGQLGSRVSKRALEANLKAFERGFAEAQTEGDA